MAEQDEDELEDDEDDDEECEECGGEGVVSSGEFDDIEDQKCICRKEE